MPNLECVDIVTYLETDFYEEQPTPEEMEYYIPFFRVSQRMSNKKSAIFVWNIAHMTHIICLFSHSAHNSQQPYDKMHQGHWLNIKFEFPQTGK